jgi:hypothetical protein
MRLCEGDGLVLGIVQLPGCNSPPRITMDLRLYSVSMAASKERIVSSGRSQRLRVGLERSGSTVSVSDWMRWGGVYVYRWDCR